MAELVEIHWEMLIEWLGRRWIKRICLSCGLAAAIVQILRLSCRQHQQNARLTKKQVAIKNNINSLQSQLENVGDITDELLGLTDLGLSELSQKIASGDVTPIQLLRAFQTKALGLYDKGNSGICDFVSEAQAIFESTFAEQAQAGQQATQNYPLYGIPISIKETFCVKGYDSTGGLIKYCNSPMHDDCVLVTVLRKVGAIPFVRTSTSQAMRTIEGDNPVYGNTGNPFNPSRIVGGSSSGEGALVAQRGSPVGLASDIGGSIRIPAAFCGLASLKPTFNRLSSLGCLNLAKRSVLGLHACPGPVARKVDDLAGVMRSLLTPYMFDLDPRVPPMPFDENAYNGTAGKPLTIGFYKTFHDKRLVRPVPVVGEAIDQALNALSKAGHRIVAFKPPNPAHAYELFVRSIFADGGRELRGHLKSEPVVPSLRFILLSLSLPNWIKLTSDVLTRFVGLGPASMAYTMGGLRNAQEAMDLLSAVRSYQAEFHKSWLEANLDALVCPAYPYPAPPANVSSIYQMPGIAYLSLYNLIDYPAGTVLTSFVDRVNVVESNKMAVDYHLEGDRYASKVATLQKESEGLPVVVQVVGKPFREELVLRVMRTIEEARQNVVMK